MAKSKGVLDEASRYLASTLHEIRTPIQTIIGTIELLQDTNMDSEQREYIRQIQFSADVLLDLANNILDFSKIRSNNFQLESVPFNICELTEQVVDLISIEAFNRGLEIITDIDSSITPLVMGDPVRVQQIILNLLKNAVKFTNTGYIHVELKKDKEMIKFRITDTGIGISDDTKKKLFTDYYQADISTYRKFGGTGLGLSICKNLVGLMKGKIGVDNNPEGGASFWFTIPHKSAMDILDAPMAPTYYDDRKILIVDDSRLASQSLTTLLNDAGITKITSIDSPELAMELLLAAQKSGNPFSLVFIDMIMPIMDGWHLASEIKNNPELRKTLTLYLLVPEGQMRAEAKMKMLNWFDGYLYKPFKKHKITELLEGELRNQSEELEELELADDEEVMARSRPEQAVAADLKILVAEDHPVNRKLLETFVKKTGADVYLAEDGQQAVQAVRENKDIDLIFMDIQMPVMNGIEATVELRKDGYNGIIIACTANNDSTDFDSYINSGINDIIVKPFKSDTIKNILEKWSTVMETASLASITNINVEINKESAWDKQSFTETVAGDMALAESIINSFIEQTDKIIAEAKNAIGTGNFTEIRAASHSLCGSAGTISATKLAEYANRLNQSAKAEDIASCNFDLNEFEHEYEVFKSLSKDYLEKK